MEFGARDIRTFKFRCLGQGGASRCHVVISGRPADLLQLKQCPVCGLDWGDDGESEHAQNYALAREALEVLERLAGNGLASSIIQFEVVE